MHSSDQELIYLFQQYREQGQYFVAIFCRYGHLVYSLINSFAQWSATDRRSSPVQAEYLFAKTWQHIFHKLPDLNLAARSTAVPDSGLETPLEETLQNWILSTAAAYVSQTELPPVEAIHYSLSAASPPLWCYLDQALERLPTTLRLMVIMAQTFHWSETRIAAYLQAEGENISPTEVEAKLQEGYRLLETFLPEDIQEIYLIATSKVPLKLD